MGSGDAVDTEEHFRFLVETDPVVTPMYGWRTAIDRVIGHPAVGVNAVVLWGFAIGFVAVSVIAR